MEQNIPIEHINNPDAPFNSPFENSQKENYIKYPRVIAEDIIDDDDNDAAYWTNDDGDEFEI